MSRGIECDVRYLVSFPRVSGDEPPITSQEALDAMFSPRERG